ncbi:3-phytase A [Bienertia sinuspersici]
MDDSSASYIHMVQHLIEKCMIFHMTKEECMEALSKHANIKPVITSTVWKELEKENKEFFEAYSKSKNDEDRMSEAETSEMIQKMISESSSKNSKD